MTDTSFSHHRESSTPSAETKKLSDDLQTRYFRLAHDILEIKTFPIISGEPEKLEREITQDGYLFKIKYEYMPHDFGVFRGINCTIVIQKPGEAKSVRLFFNKEQADDDFSSGEVKDWHTSLSFVHPDPTATGGEVRDFSVALNKSPETPDAESLATMKAVTDKFGTILEKWSMEQSAIGKTRAGQHEAINNLLDF